MSGPALGDGTSRAWPQADAWDHASLTPVSSFEHSGATPWLVTTAACPKAPTLLATARG